MINDGHGDPRGYPPAKFLGGLVKRCSVYIAIAILLALSVAKFLYEDLYRLTYPVNDLTVPWVSSKSFVAGMNPYNDTQEFERIWAATSVTAKSGCRDFNCILHVYAMAYPPMSLPLIVPLAILPWRDAVYTYLAASTALFVAVVLMLAHKLPRPWRDPRTLYLVAFALAMAPLHSGIHESNLNTLIVALVIAGATFMWTRPYLSGVALAAALCLKPPVAFLFFAYPWIRKKWKAAFTGLAACMVISFSSLLWMKFHHVEWFHSYIGSVAYWSTIGTSRFDAPGPGKFQMLNLQVLVFQLIHSSEWTNIISWSIFLVIAAVTAYLINSRVSDRNESVGLAAVAVLTLLPVYQRFYTAAILVLVLFWAVENWPLGRAKIALLLMLPLLLPVAAMTQVGAFAEFVRRHELGSKFLWSAFFMPHVIWIELFLLLILLWSMALHDKAYIQELVEAGA